MTTGKNIEGILIGLLPIAAGIGLVGLFFIDIPYKGLLFSFLLLTFLLSQLAVFYFMINRSLSGYFIIRQQKKKPALIIVFSGLLGILLWLKKGDYYYSLCSVLLILELYISYTIRKKQPQILALEENYLLVNAFKLSKYKIDELKKIKFGSVSGDIILVFNKSQSLAINPEEFNKNDICNLIHQICASQKINVELSYEIKKYLHLQ